MFKKIFCIALALLTLTAALCAPIPASAEDTSDGYLVVTANGKDPVTVKVGEEFICHVGLYAGPVKLQNGQAELLYDADYVQFDPYIPEDCWDAESYIFAPAVYKSGLFMYTEYSGFVNYNYSRISGVDTYDSADKFYARFRFKATAPGRTDITHTIRYMRDINDYVLYYKSVPDDKVNPYTVTSVERTEGMFGDADGDLNVTVMDATYIQQIAAGADREYSEKVSDLNADGAVSLRDAVTLRRHLAKKKDIPAIGTWLFASED